MPYAFPILRICIVLSLAGLFSFGLWQHRASFDIAEREVVYEVTMSAREMSEVVAEGKALSASFQLMQAGLIPIEAVQTEFDILWSRVVLVEAMSLDPASALASSVVALRAFLDVGDTILFRDVAPSLRELSDLQAQLDMAVTNLRRSWATEFRGRGLDAWIGAQTEITRGRAVTEVLILGFILLALLYLGLEILLASRRAAREAGLRTVADDANRAKSAFIANVSHEVRTPLNGIVGMVSVLAEKPLPPDQRLCVDVIKTSADLLLDTINDVLDLSKIEAGEMPIAEGPFDLAPVVHDAIRLYTRMADEKGLALHSVAEGLPRVVGDERKLRQILHNLLANAIKFTAAGEVTLTARYADGQLGVTVADTGVGIAENDLKTVFEPFGQVDAGTEGGTGLGLPISRSLARAMGGDLTVVSQVKAGTRFTVTLPLPMDAVSVAVDKSTVALGAGRGLNVLVAERIEVNRLVLEHLLGTMRASVGMATSGREALSMYRASAYDLVMLDMRMPGMDGLETARQIMAEARERKRRAPFIVALTADAMAEQTQTYLTAGIADVLVRPVTQEALLAVLERAQLQLAA